MLRYEYHIIDVIGNAVVTRIVNESRLLQLKVFTGVEKCYVWGFRDSIRVQNCRLLNNVIPSKRIRAYVSLNVFVDFTRTRHGRKRVVAKSTRTKQVELSFFTCFILSAASFTYSVRVHGR